MGQEERGSQRVGRVHTLTSTLNAVPNTDSLVVAVPLTQGDTMARIGIVLKHRHVDGWWLG